MSPIMCILWGEMSPMCIFWGEMSLMCIFWGKCLLCAVAVLMSLKRELDLMMTHYKIWYIVNCCDSRNKVKVKIWKSLKKHRILKLWWHGMIMIKHRYNGLRAIMMVRWQKCHLSGSPFHADYCQGPGDTICDLIPVQYTSVLYMYKYKCIVTSV